MIFLFWASGAPKLNSRMLVRERDLSVDTAVHLILHYHCSTINCQPRFLARSQQASGCLVLLCLPYSSTPLERNYQLFTYSHDNVPLASACARWQSQPQMARYLLWESFDCRGNRIHLCFSGKVPADARTTSVSFSKHGHRRDAGIHSSFQRYVTRFARS